VVVASARPNGTDKKPVRGRAVDDNSAGLTAGVLVSPAPVNGTGKSAPVDISPGKTSFRGAGRPHLLELRLTALVILIAMASAIVALINGWSSVYMSVLILLAALAGVAASMETRLRARAEREPAAPQPLSRKHI